MSARPVMITALTVSALALAGCSGHPTQETSPASSATSSAVVSPSASSTPDPSLSSPGTPAPVATSTATPSLVPTPAVAGDGSFPQAADADRSNVDSVARVAAVMLHSWDTAVDRTETAAAVRTTPLMSDAWAANQVEPERNSAQGEWLEPAKHRAYSRAVAVPAVGDTSRNIGKDKAVRSYKVTWRWASRDGVPATGTGSREVVVYLEKHYGAWEVVGHQFLGGTTDVGGGEQ